MHNMSSLPRRYFHRHLPSQGKFTQSLSGSETDVSTSNENLSQAERYAIRNTPRQEPQGQENLSSNRSSLDVSSSSYNTLIIHDAGDEPWTGRLSGTSIPSDSTTGGTNYLASHSFGTSQIADGSKKLGSHSPSPSLASKERAANFDSSGSGRLFDPSVREITDIPDDYLNQSQVLKHLAKEVKVSPAEGEQCEDMVEQLKHLSLCHSSDIEYSAPPPEYPKWVVQSDKLSLSRSLTDLTRLVADTCKSVSTSPRPKTNGRENVGREIWSPAEMVEVLAQENSSLKDELEKCYQKVAKSQKLEQEISKVHRTHEELVQSSERRERLERAARTKLQADVRHLQDINRSLREQIERLSTQHRLPSDLGDENLRKELGKREVLIAQLITQNKELVAAKERQEIELAAQRATLQEQRTHINILDTALTNAQSNVVRLEEEIHKKQMYVERVAQLQRALSSLQQASERREQTEKKLRLQLERELCNERSRVENNAGEINQPGETAADLKRQLREREEKIMRLEGEVAKWEQRYLEESALRQAAIDAASIPKDAKIAALEKTSQETEKLIAEARSEKIRHMDEVHAAQKKVADLESKVKDLESKLAERDAMIRVLQKHTYDKDVSSFPNMLVLSPHHSHGNSDLLGTSVSREELDPVSTTSVFSTVSSVLTSSCSTGISSYAGSDPYHYSRSKYGSVANKSFDDTQKSLDDQLKELNSQLDSQLLSKRGLCCFPGFSNTGTAPRKGKIPKPLLASVSGAFEPGFLQGLVPSRYEQERPEEILLLEKQGRSSQQQRAGSLPPTSLPRPRRSKLGEYGRLSDGEGRKASSGTPPRSEDYSRLSDSSRKKPGLPTPPRSNISSPAPSNAGEYSRFSDGEIRKNSTSSHHSNILSSNNIGEYERLSNSNTRKNSASSQLSNIPLPNSVGEYGRLSEVEKRKNSLASQCSSNAPTSNVGEYSRLDDAEPPKRSSSRPSNIPSPSATEFSRIGDGEIQKISHRTSGNEYTRMTDGESRKLAHRSNIPSPSPKKLGEYGRLESEGRSLRKPTIRVGNKGGSGGGSMESTTSSNEETKLCLFSGPRSRRGSSLSRDTKSCSANSSGSGKSIGSTGKYRIQF